MAPETAENPVHPLNWQMAWTRPPETVPPFIEAIRLLIHEQKTNLREAECHFQAVAEQNFKLEDHLQKVADGFNSASPKANFIGVPTMGEKPKNGQDSVCLDSVCLDDCDAVVKIEGATIQDTEDGPARADTEHSQASAREENMASWIFDAQKSVRESQIIPNPKARWWTRLVSDPRFDLALGGVIIANTVVMSLQIEYEGRLLEMDMAGECDGECQGNGFAQMSFFVLEQIFTAVFAIELMLRLRAGGCKYLHTFANIGDAVIVIVSSLDSWILTHIGSDGMQNVAILRLVRLVRLSKVLRVVRVMKAFKSLRVLVSAVANSVGALAWSMTLLFVLELIGAIFLAQVLQPVIVDLSQDPSKDKLRAWLIARFGTWLHSMLSLFEITMAPGGFIGYRRLYEEVHPLFGFFLVIYVCVVTFAVVRVITAMFLKATLSASDTDEARVTKEKDAFRAEFAEKLNEQIVDGELTEDLLTVLLTAHQIKDWLADVQLTDEGAFRLFRAMDPGTGTVNFTDYAQAIQRIRPTPKGADACVMLYENVAMMARLEEALALINSMAARHRLPSPGVKKTTNTVWASTSVWTHSKTENLNSFPDEPTHLHSG